MCHPTYTGGVAGSAQFLDSVQPRLRPYLLQGVTSLAGNAFFSLLVIELFVLKLVSGFIDPLVQEKPLKTRYGVLGFEQRVSLAGTLPLGVIKSAVPAAPG